MTTPKSATPSMSAARISAAVWIRPAASGCRAMPSTAWPPMRPMPMPAPITASPAPNPAPTATIPAGDVVTVVAAWRRGRITTIGMTP
jgi:hypothetical protein